MSRRTNTLQHNDWPLSKSFHLKLQTCLACNKLHIKRESERPEGVCHQNMFPTNNVLSKVNVSSFPVSLCLSGLFPLSIISRKNLLARQPSIHLLGRQLAEPHWKSHEVGEALPIWSSSFTLTSVSNSRKEAWKPLDRFPSRRHKQYQKKQTWRYSPSPLKGLQRLQLLWDLLWWHGWPHSLDDVLPQLISARVCVRINFPVYSPHWDMRLHTLNTFCQAASPALWPCVHAYVTLPVCSALIVPGLSLSLSW